jgi:hypothetical protein
MQEPGTGQQPGATQPLDGTPLNNTQPSMNTTPPGGYAPIPEPSGYMPPMQTAGNLQNDSGTGPTAKLPAELQGFNLGACLMTWIWSIGMQFWLGLLVIPAVFVLSFIPLIGPIANIGAMIFFGIKGNEWAWQHRRWDSAQQFRDTQRVWMYWGIGLFILGVVLAIFAFVAGMSFLAANNQAIMNQAMQNPGTFQPR